MRKWKMWALILAAGGAAACSRDARDQIGVDASRQHEPHLEPAAYSPMEEAFFRTLFSMCGTAYAGELVSEDAEDRAIIDKQLVMHVRQCRSGQIKVHFYIGDDRSRTWAITKTENSLSLVHEHRQEGGESAGITGYGGWSRPAGPNRLEFPADDGTRALFVRMGLDKSLDNVWALELQPERLFAYELNRPQRHFRAEFDLTRRIETPPDPWGADGE